MTTNIDTFGHAMDIEPRFRETQGGATDMETYVNEYAETVKQGIADDSRIWRWTPDSFTVFEPRDDGTYKLLDLTRGRYGWKWSVNGTTTDDGPRHTYRIGRDRAVLVDRLPAGIPLLERVIA